MTRHERLPFERTTHLDDIGDLLFITILRLQALAIPAHAKRQTRCICEASRWLLDQQPGQRPAMRLAENRADQQCRGGEFFTTAAEISAGAWAAT
jgi:hypothetical protein